MCASTKENRQRACVQRLPRECFERVCSDFFFLLHFSLTSLVFTFTSLSFSSGLVSEARGGNTCISLMFETRATYRWTDKILIIFYINFILHCLCKYLMDVNYSILLQVEKKVLLFIEKRKFHLT